MRDNIYKYAPLVFGSILGWMLWHPPVWLQSLGPLAWVVNIALIAVLLVSGIAVVILGNLPSRVEMEAVKAEAIDAELRVLGEKIERLGFRPAGPPRRVKIAPSAIVLGYVHESQPAYATAFRTETVPQKISSDFVSILHDNKGGLTTNRDPGGAALPQDDGSLRQVITDASLEELFYKHLDGIAYLRERGVHCRALSADTFPQDLAHGIGKQREIFAASPIKGTLVTLWRSATKKIPFVGPLREQSMANEQIDRLLRR